MVALRFSPFGLRCSRTSGLRPPSNPSPTTISKTMHLERGAFFCNGGEEITAQAVNDVKHRGVETSGSTSLAMCVRILRKQNRKAIHLPPPSTNNRNPLIRLLCIREWILSVWLPCASRPLGCDAHARRACALRRIHLPVPFTCSTVCKDGFFVLKLPLLQQFFHLAEKRWKDWLCSTNIPQFAHICGKSPSTMSEVQK